MGFKTQTIGSRRSANTELAQRYFDENAALKQRLLQGLPSNRDLLQQFA
jgi:hypothetical protein